MTAQPSVPPKNTEHFRLANFVPTPAQFGNLVLGGIAGLVVWEFWARVLTRAILGYPLEPAGLLNALFHHNLGFSPPWLVLETLHYLVGIFGYPLAWWAVSRNIPRHGLVLDAVVVATFTAGVLYYWSTGRGTAFHALFWLGVMAFVATRRINPSPRLADALSWGNFTWLNALGIFAPLAGLSFYLLGEGGELSFMSFVGHVVYGTIAVLVYEVRQSGRATP